MKSPFLMQLFVKSPGRDRAYSSQITSACGSLAIWVDLTRLWWTSSRKARRLPAGNTKMNLSICANYGGRWDIMQAVEKMIAASPGVTSDFRKTILPPISRWVSVRSRICSSVQVAKRISNFMLWQLAYSELYFTEAVAEFGEAELDEAIASYQGRERRFGRTSEQLAPGNTDRLNPVMLKARVITAPPPRGLLAAVFLLPAVGWLAFVSRICAAAAAEWGGIAGFSVTRRRVYALLLGFCMAGGLVAGLHRNDAVAPFSLVPVYAVSALFWLLWCPVLAASPLGDAGSGRGVDCRIGASLPPSLANGSSASSEPVAAAGVMAAVWVADIAAYFTGAHSAGVSWRRPSVRAKLGRRLRGGGGRGDLRIYLFFVCWASMAGVGSVVLRRPAGGVCYSGQHHGRSVRVDAKASGRREPTAARSFPVMVAFSTGSTV